MGLAAPEGFKYGVCFEQGFLVVERHVKRGGIRYDDMMLLEEASACVMVVEEAIVKATGSHDIHVRKAQL